MPPETEVDPVENVEEAIVEVAVEEPEVKTASISDDRVEKIVDGISKRLEKMEQPKKEGPSPEQIKAIWMEQVKKETQMTDAQIEYMENRLQAVIAPFQADSAYSEWKSEKQAAGIEIDTEVEKGVKEYLKGYDPRIRSDKTLLDNILYMELGKRYATKKPVAKKVEDITVEQPVIGRPKIVPQTPEPARSLAAGVRKPGSSTLTAEEKTIARKMRMTEAEYASAKETAVISELKKK